MWNTPCPAPSSSRDSRLRSFHSNQRALLRQHRSMDDPDGLYGLDDDLVLDPLSISTSIYPPPRGAPLSNPISTTHAFWQQQQQMQQPTSATAGGFASSGLKGYSLEVEYEQLRQEYTATLEKLNQTMFSIKTFWSPELKRERQLRREEQSRMAMLERRLGESGMHHGSPLDGGLSMEMEQRMMQMQETNSRLMETVRNKEEHIAALCMQDTKGSRRALEKTLQRLDDANLRVVNLQDEVMQLRNNLATKPRDFTEKGATSHELVTLRMKMERSEVELSEKKTELMTCQTRLRNAEDELNELRSHVQLLKDTATTKEEQSTLLLEDVQALRGKLELRNRSVEAKEDQMHRLQKEVTEVKAESADRMENIRKLESRSTQVLGRLEQCEGTLREKEKEMELMRQKLAAHPDTHREREWNARLEEGNRERLRLQKAVDEVRITAEKEHKSQLDTYQAEVSQLRQSVETLEKELADRDVLLESQNEKIGDLSKDLTGAHKRMQDAMVDKGTQEIRVELESARVEVDKLLKMLHNLEKEKAMLTAKCKQLLGEKDAAAGDDLKGISVNANVKQRIQELEEALAESVSITAEREVHLAQQKQIMHQTSNQLGESRRENKELRARLSSVAGEGHEALLKSIEVERKQHMEQLFQLKQEAILSAISEKEAHIVLLERSNSTPAEIETIRRQKEALMRKLQDENERRSFLHRPHSSAGRIPSSSLPHSSIHPPSIHPGNVSAGVPMTSQGAKMVPGMGAAPHSNPNISHPPMDNGDDGIWA
ncbi:hypothetical protein PFISCL1PPCAC_14662 [Pristionchus fissidentatus]|uniref:Uncharacterized protein n=1 Tax=Pristionchus fissidentatus TaxID=1538716 RepID=A0AAV5VY04_9BILA|nr:hypothetical protein PFISCL1PPCAC_14662 [Pristionchus fissidentatus]